MRKNNEVKILKELLKRKIDFIINNSDSKNFYSLKNDFISTVFKAKELEEPLIKIILDHRINDKWLQSTFNDYMMTQMFYHVDINDIANKKKDNNVRDNFVWPVFLSKTISKKSINLIDNFTDFMRVGFEEAKEIEIKESERKEINEIGTDIVISEEEYRLESYNLRKLYIDLITELDLIDLSNQDNSIFIKDTRKPIINNKGEIKKDKINLTINKTEKSILREDNNKKHQFRKTKNNIRFNFLIKIIQNKISPSRKLSKNSYSYVSGEITEINNILKEKLNLIETIIINNEEESGYRIDENFYNIKLI